MRLGGSRRAGDESSRMVTPTHQRQRGVRVGSRCPRRAFEITGRGGYAGHMTCYGRGQLLRGRRVREGAVSYNPTAHAKLW